MTLSKTRVPGVDKLFIDGVYRRPHFNPKDEARLEIERMKKKSTHTRYDISTKCKKFQKHIVDVSQR